MNLFHVIDGAFAITTCRGVYRQVAVFRKGVEIYARHGNGFIRLMGNKGTTAPNVSWLEITPHDSIRDPGGITAPTWG